jgi:hypothetical protein
MGGVFSAAGQAFQPLDCTDSTFQTIQVSLTSATSSTRSAQGLDPSCFKLLKMDGGARLCYVSSNTQQVNQCRSWEPSVGWCVHMCAESARVMRRQRRYAGKSADPCPCIACLLLL